MADAKSMKRDGFVTTGKRPFRHDSFPMRLFEKAKKLGTWNPSDIDFSRDAEWWEEMSDQERDASLSVLSVFQAGEESVTLDLLPLIMAVAQEGRIEEEIYLTSFLWEEAKHTQFFNRFLREMPGALETDLAQYHTENYRKIFYEIQPQTLWALQEDPSPRNQLRASICYNMIVEGVLAETGYFGFYYQQELVDEEERLPGLLEGINLLRQDESRHIAFGVYLISRLLAENPELWDETQQFMNELLTPAMAFVQEQMTAQIDRWGSLPNDADPQVITEYATGQFQKRMARLEKARNHSLAEIDEIAIDIGVDAA